MAAHHEPQLSIAQGPTYIKYSGVVVGIQVGDTAIYLPPASQSTPAPFTVSAAGGSIVVYADGTDVITPGTPSYTVPDGGVVTFVALDISEMDIGISWIWGIVGGWGVLPYTPAVTGDWTGDDPTSLSAAVDRIAAALGPIA